MRFVLPAALTAALSLVPSAYPRSAFASDAPAQPGVAPATVAASTAEPEGYLVLPFENDSPIKSLDWMSSALAVTLAEKLEALPQLRPSYGAAILEGWPPKLDESKVVARARESAARWVFAGSFARPDWKAQVMVRLLRVESGALREVAREARVGSREQLLELLDRAIDGVIATRGWSPTGDALSALHRRPTRDLYAFTLFGRGLNLFYGLGQQRSDEQARKTLQRVTFIDPRFAEAHRALGLVDLSLGEDARAAGQYAHALDLKPNYYPALVGLAQLYRAQNKKQPAREMAEKALALRPWDVDMRLLLGTIELEAGELDRALANLTHVCAARPKLLPARRALSQVYAARGEVAELADELGRIAELQPDDLDVKLDLGAAWMRLGRYARAIAAYDDVLRRQPRHVQALKFTGDLHRRLGDTRRAIEAYERVRHLAPDDPRAYFLLGAAYAEAGNDAKALAVLDEAQRFKGYVGEAWTNLGALWLRRGDLNKATWYLSRAVARAPMRPKAHFNYALLLDATKQRDRALAELRTAAELDPEDAENHYLSGVILLRVGRLNEAKAEFADTLRLKPAHADAKHNLAMLEALEKRYGAEHAGAGAQ